MKKMKKFKISRVLVQFGLLFWTAVQLYPMIYMFICSFRDSGSILRDPFSLPDSFYLENYIDAWLGNSMTVEYRLQHYFMNSLIITVISLVLLCLVSMLAGYSLCRFKFPGYRPIYIGIVCLLAIPAQALIVPIFVMMQRLGGLNNIMSMVPLLITFNLPMSIIIMKTNFEAIPIEIEEAACIDGCTKFRTFWHVSMPMSRGSIATVTIVNLTSVWSEYMYSSTILMLPESRTLPVAVALFNTNIYNNTLGPQMAALAISSLPLMLAYFVFQKQITKGMTLGAIK